MFSKLNLWRVKFCKGFIVSWTDGNCQHRWGCKCRIDSVLGISHGTSATNWLFGASARSYPTLSHENRIAVWHLSTSNVHRRRYKDHKFVFCFLRLRYHLNSITFCIILMWSYTLTFKFFSKKTLFSDHEDSLSLASSVLIVFWNDFALITPWFTLKLRNPHSGSYFST